MRTPLRSAIVAIAAALALTSLAMAQAPQSQKETPEHRQWRYNGRDRAEGTGGPAPVHDLSGTWAGPLSGAGVPGLPQPEVPSFTPMGQKLFAANRPIGKYSPAGTNDANFRTCDPFGFPRAALDEIRGIQFGTMPNRIVVMYQFQQVWREIWMDGRELPKNVGSAEKGAPDPRYYGYSVGRWENDNTLVVETTGLDENTWLTKSGYPHASATRIEERYTRADHNDLKVTLTAEDPTIYTKPFSLGTVYFRWIPGQLVDEKLCIPSDTIEYLKSVGDPAGMDPNIKTPAQPQLQR
jgi:hypothetical protein